MFRPLRRSDAGLVMLVSLVALVGAVASIAVTLFEHTAEWLFEAGYHRLPAALSGVGLPSWTPLLLYPVLLGLAVAAVKRLVPGSDRQHSIALVILSLVKRQGQIRPVSTLLKTLGSVITLGAGGSLGREGPVVLLGGGLGSAVGQAFRIDPGWLSTLVAAGAGSAVATAFHAPITGALFVMEIVLIQFSARSFALVALACVVASEVSRLMVGAPSFPIPAYRIGSSWEILLYILLGIVIAPLARAYIEVVYGSERLGERLKAVPAWLKPALGGLLFGLVAIMMPRTLGGGYETIREALSGQLPLALLLMLFVGKLLAIGFTSGAGWPGGVFTPALFLGAMAGGAFGLIAASVVPGVVAQPGAYAVVGMAAMIAGATQAPLTAMTLIFEVTRDYQIAAPAMLACGIAAVFSQRMSPFSIDTLHLPEHGIVLPWQIKDLREITVEKAMKRSVHTVGSNMLLGEVITLMQTHRHGGYPVVDERGRLVGMVTLGDVREVPLEGRLETPVSRVMRRELASVTTQHSVADAALLMARRQVGRLPVVDPADPSRLVGILSRSDILHAYPTETRPEDDPMVRLG